MVVGDMRLNKVWKYFGVTPCFLLPTSSASRTQVEEMTSFHYATYWSTYFKQVMLIMLQQMKISFNPKQNSLKMPEKSSRI